MTTGKQARLDSAQSIKSELSAVIDGMAYCLDWKPDPQEWSARDLVYHILDTPPGGVHSLVKGILAGEVREYELWSGLTNVTAERARYDMDQITADIDSFFQGLDEALSIASDDDLERTTVIMHHRTRGLDEERTLETVLERTLEGHIRSHLAQLRALRETLGI